MIMTYLFLLLIIQVGDFFILALYEIFILFFVI